MLVGVCRGRDRLNEDGDSGVMGVGVLVSMGTFVIGLILASQVICDILLSARER